MASMNQCLASLARLSLTSPARPILPQSTVPRFLAPATATATAQQTRTYAANPQKDKKEKKKRRVHKNFRVDRLDKMQQFSLCDAIRYVPLGHRSS